MIGLLLMVLLLMAFIIPLIRKGQRIDIFIIWGLYFISSILALYFEPTTIRGFSIRENYNDFIFVFYGILLCYALSPLYVLSKYHKEKLIIKFIFNRREKFVFYFAIIGGVFSILYSVPYALKSLALGALEVRTSMQATDESIFPKTIWTTIAVAFATFFSLFLGWFFLSLNSKLSRFIKVFLFIISLSYIVNSLAYMARDGLLFFVIFASILLINYWNTLTKKIKKNLVIVSLFSFGIILFLLVSFTSSRFSEGGGVMGYIATQPYVFAENIEQRSQKDYFYGTSLRFPIINNLLGRKVNDIYRPQPYEWTFGTFLTDFYNVSGLASLLIILICFIEFFRYQFINCHWASKRFFVIYILYIHFMVSGLFYFRLGTFSGNIFILVMIIYALMLSNKKPV